MSIKKSFEWVNLYSHAARDLSDITSCSFNSEEVPQTIFALFSSAMSIIKVELALGDLIGFWQFNDGSTLDLKLVASGFLIRD